MSASTKSSSGSSSYNYYGSIAGVVCVGPVDELVKILVDGEDAWELGNVCRESAENPYVGTIAGYGEFRFYWGSEDQELAADSILRAENNSLAEDHPDYKGICFIEFKDFLFGLERTSAPSIEVVVNRAPVQSLITGTAAELDDDQANLLAGAAELMTNTRFGLGSSPASFDADSFQDTADALHAFSDLCYGSPLLSSQQDFSAYLSAMGLMTDAFFRWNSATGLIEAGSWPHDDSTIDVDLLPVITADDLTDPPDLDAETWTGMETGWAVSYFDRDDSFKNTSQKYDDISLIEMAGEPNRVTLSRPYITRSDQALSYATEWGSSHALPSLSGTISVRKTRAQNLEVGSLFKLDVDVEPGGDQLQQVCRITAMNRPKVGAVEVTIEAETSLVPVAYTSANTPGSSVSRIAEPAPLQYVRPIELPPKLSETDYGIAILAQRGDTMTIGFTALYDDSAAGDFPSMGTQRNFGVRATLASAFPASALSADDSAYDSATDAPVLDTSLALNVDLLNLADDCGLTAARNNTLLLFLMEIEDAGDRAGQIKLDADGFPIYEILSVSAMTVPAEGQRTIEALRGRFGTTQQEFSPGAEAWLINKSGIQIYAHDDFSAAAANQTPCYFKTEPYNIYLARDISADDTEEFLFPTDRVFAPSIELTTAPTSGYVGVALSIAGIITDQDGDLSYWSLSYENPDTLEEVSVAGGPLEATDAYSFSVPLTFTASGTYEIIVRAKDNTTYTDSYVEESFNITVTVAGDGDPPGTPTNLSATSGLMMIWLSWTNPADSDFDYVEIWESSTDDLAAATKLAEARGAFYAHSVSTDDAHYYWIRAFDTSGNNGAYTTSISAAATVTSSDLTEADVTAIAVAQIAAATITSAQIGSLDVSKLTGGTIDAITMILAANGVFKSENYVADAAGFLLNGSGAVELNNATIRNGTVVGGTSQSSNYVAGESGAMINWDTGAAEFWDVSIYGTIATPQVFVGSVELASGNSYGYLQSVTLTISVAAGCTAYYRTDGAVPSGLAAEEVPASGQITLTEKIQLKLVAFEDATSRSSSTFAAEINVQNPMACRGRGPADSDEIFVRSYYESAKIAIGYANGTSALPNSWDFLTPETFYDADGNADGWVVGGTSPDASVVWWCHTSGNDVSSSRIGHFYCRSGASYPDFWSGTDTIYIKDANADTVSTFSSTVHEVDDY